MFYYYCNKMNEKFDLSDCKKYFQSSCDYSDLFSNARFPFYRITLYDAYIFYRLFFFVLQSLAEAVAHCVTTVRHSAYIKAKLNVVGCFYTLFQQAFTSVIS